jgi:CRP-like cAMP-binding protein
MELTKKDRVGLLQSVWLFQPCTRRELNQLLTLTAVRDVPAGHQLTRDGQPRREFMVIVDGKADVMRKGKVVALIGPGDCVGEISLLDRREHVATVVATEPTRLLVMTGASFDLLLRDQPSFARNLLRTVSRRLRQALEDPFADALTATTPVTGALGHSDAARYGAFRRARDIT